MASNAGMHAYLGKSMDYFAFFGVACAAYFGYRLFYPIMNGVKVFFLARSLGLSANLKRFGTWAVVTGATDGIGKAYAEQLAQIGLNIVLVSRTPEKLKLVANEIETNYNVKTKVIAANFCHGTDIYPGIRAALEGMDIGVLVNNVGMSYPCPEYFLDVENREKCFMDLIHINVTSLTMMTSIVMPGMVERGKGAVINISSLSGMCPTLLLTVYSACKAYADFFSVCLNDEYKSKGIIVQSVMPGFVATNMTKIKRGSLNIPLPSTYVRSALATVGLEQRTNGYWPHSVLAWFASSVPRAIFVKANRGLLLSARSRYLKKKQREGKSE